MAKKEQSANYDRKMVAAETAARQEREEEKFKDIPEEEQQAKPDSIDTAGGFTVDREGLANNYPIEPEMYVNEPGDLRPQKEEEKAERVEELEEVQETDEQGDLAKGKDERGRGPGLI